MNYALAVKVDSLHDLMEGWFNDAIDPYPVPALDWLLGLLDHMISGFSLPLPYLYPMPEGRVRAGWASSRWDVIADIDLATHAVAVVACEVGTHALRERKLSLEKPGAESQLGRFLAGHTK
jgi:hypothetical protein